MRISRVLWVIFIITLGSRLFFAFQTESFEPEAYYTLRQVEHIRQTGLPITSDPLSYGGRTQITLPLFHYILAFFDIFLPLSLVAKVIPNLFASLIVFAVYMIAKEITKNDSAALLASFMSGFIPVFFSETIYSVSAFSLSSLLILLLIYCLIWLHEHKIFATYFVIIFFLLTFTHGSAAILVLSLLVYLLLLKIGKIRLARAELELIVFSGFFLVWVHYIIYKSAFLFHGPSVVWQNIPADILTGYFSQVRITESIYMIGVLPVLCGIFVIYTSVFQENNRISHLLVAFAVSTGLLLWLRMIELKIGLMVLGLVLVLLFSQFYSSFFRYLEKTRLSDYWSGIMVIVFILFVLTSLIPSLRFASSVRDNLMRPDELQAYLWLRGNAQGTVLAAPEEGHIINYISQKRNVMDTNFLLIDNVNQRFRDVDSMFSVPYTTSAISLLTKYDVDYIIVSRHAKSRYGINDLPYLDDRCFRQVYNESALIYQPLCTLK
ncbi:MAG: hypothetical protein ABH879_09445 [archaeon]